MAEPNGKLAGKVALITGAGSGMGYAATRLFISEGASVIAVDHAKDSLSQWEATAGVVTVVADVTALDGIERMVGEAEKRFGRLDCLLNIAGINDLSYPLEDTDDARWDRVIDIDLKAPFRICRRAIGTMVKGGGGSIVNIGSYAARAARPVLYGPPTPSPAKYPSTMEKTLFQ